MAIRAFKIVFSFNSCSNGFHLRGRHVRLTVKTLVQLFIQESIFSSPFHHFDPFIAMLVFVQSREYLILKCWKFYRLSKSISPEKIHACIFLSNSQNGLLNEPLWSVLFCIKFSQKEVGEVRYQNAHSKSELNFQYRYSKESQKHEILEVVSPMIAFRGVFEK